MSLITIFGMTMLHFIVQFGMMFFSVRIGKGNDKTAKAIAELWHIPLIILVMFIGSLLDSPLDGVWTPVLIFLAWKIIITHVLD